MRGVRRGWAGPDSVKFCEAVSGMSPLSVTVGIPEIASQNFVELGPDRSLLGVAPWETLEKPWFLKRSASLPRPRADRVAAACPRSSGCGNASADRSRSSPASHLSSDPRRQHGDVPRLLARWPVTKTLETLHPASHAHGGSLPRVGGKTRCPRGFPRKHSNQRGASF